jgi:hypothetical protein
MLLSEIRSIEPTQSQIHPGALSSSPQMTIEWAALEESNDGPRRAETDRQEPERWDGMS